MFRDEISRIITIYIHWNRAYKKVVIALQQHTIPLISIYQKTLCDAADVAEELQLKSEKLNICICVNFPTFQFWFQIMFYCCYCFKQALQV